MSIQLIQQKIQELEDLLNHHNYAYYVLDEPTISDFEFDELMNELILLENRYPELASKLSPTKRVGGELLDRFETVKHNYPMLSLSNTYSKSELEDFDHRVKKKIGAKKINYTCELKYDGVAVTLIYIDGLFHKALTRGDGVFGDDVTENIKTIKSIPLKLFGDPPSFLEVRGEVFIEKNIFNKINNDRKNKLNILEREYANKKRIIDQVDLNKIERQFLAESKKLTPYSNARNFASGTLKLLDSKRVAKRGLSCVLYSLHSPTLPYDNHFDNLLEAKKWGFNTPKDIKLSSDINTIMSFIQKMEQKRKDLPFEIDGVVIKVNNLIQQDLLGSTEKSPRWAISYKFKASQAETILNSITYQIGRTGAITPVAELNPVILAGSTIKRASLHNEDFIKNLKLKIGDHVIIEKGGDVIPKVVSVNFKKRHLLCEDISFIANCPACGSELKRLTNEANYYCLNSDSCVPQKISQVEHFVSREAMNIHALGTKTIKLLFDLCIIENIGDLYDLNLMKLTGLQGFGEKAQFSKKAQNIIDSINESKSQSFQKVLYALGIRYVGKTVAKKLVSHFSSIEHLMAASFEDLLAVEEVGEKIANSVCMYFKSVDNIKLIQRLQKAGLLFRVVASDLRSNVLNGSSFVISGVFSISRDDLREMIEQHGGRNLTALSKNTNYLIVGENFGQKKREIALALGVPILLEKDFIKMIE
ncbi:MAG: DNA ligase (NAD(+)) LigA [Flavobacteriales bacterium]|nr:DNA ligase (NAD(+)) LigA [Flavobacteriales bacterium]